MRRESLTKRVVEHRDSVRKSSLKKYGLTLVGYDRLYNRQKGCCAICGRHQWELNRALDVDHNHKTDKVRGLLCGDCNRGLGCFKDSRGCLVKAIQYLTKYR